MIVQDDAAYIAGMIAFIEFLIELQESQNHYSICPIGWQGPFGGGSPGPGGGGTGGGAGGAGGGGGGGGGNGGGSGGGGGALGGQNPPYTPPAPPGGGMGGSGSGAVGANYMDADHLNSQRGYPLPSQPDNHLNGVPPYHCA